jgi:hypothetical protein
MFTFIEELFAIISGCIALYRWLMANVRTMSVAELLLNVFAIIAGTLILMATTAGYKYKFYLDFEDRVIRKKTGPIMCLVIPYCVMPSTALTALK